MLKRGFLAFRQFKPSFAHTEENVKDYKKNVEDVFYEISKSNIYFNTPNHHLGFKRLYIKE